MTIRMASKRRAVALAATGASLALILSACADTGGGGGGDGEETAGAFEIDCAAYDEFGAHEYIAFAPVWQAWQKFFPDEGRPVPRTFSRNATAHTVSTKQFTRRNAVQGLMIACGILVFLDEQATALESRSLS